MTYPARRITAHAVVLLETPGYRDWSRADVRVSTETCGLRTVSLTARLQAN
ncbi:MAG TPA: hypothetical protein VJR24_16830 [Gemmatimonadaceae bacterium]|nr:hypothetical protein [Gemmatimonadaceae bacterium]